MKENNNKNNASMYLLLLLLLFSRRPVGGVSWPSVWPGKLISGQEYLLWADIVKPAPDLTNQVWPAFLKPANPLSVKYMYLSLPSSLCPSLSFSLSLPSSFPRFISYHSLSPTCLFCPLQWLFPVKLAIWRYVWILFRDTKSSLGLNANLFCFINHKLN